MTTGPLITVCICTFKRPAYLRDLLQALPGQRRESTFQLAVVVVDNDAERSAEGVVSEFKAENSIPNVIYRVQPVVNIARTRNLAVAHSAGELTAFIDDDELPEPNWLANLYRALLQCGADAVLGPVVPRFEAQPPPWVIQGAFFQRPRLQTGQKVRWQDSRTGNVLARTEVLKALSPVFREEFSAGGEDVDMFQRLAIAGRIVVWADDAIVTESVPQARCSLKYLLRSAALRGGTFADRRLRVSDAVRSVVALPLYMLALPVLMIGGRHHVYTYLVKIVDHGARLLGYLGVKLVTSRAVQ